MARRKCSAASNEAALRRACSAASCHAATARVASPAASQCWASTAFGVSAARARTAAAPRVELAAAALEQGLVGRLLHERVLEGVGGLRAEPPRIEQLRVAEAARAPARSPTLGPLRDGEQMREARTRARAPRPPAPRPWRRPAGRAAPSRCLGAWPGCRGARSPRRTRPPRARAPPRRAGCRPCGPTSASTRSVLARARGASPRRSAPRVCRRESRASESCA